MSEKKAWKNQEDKTLCHLYQEEKIKNWNSIAKKMAEQLKLPSRNGKQCKQRYLSIAEQTPSNNLHNSWDLDEQQEMNRLHDQIGNKWAIIAQNMKGRTDNCVKNHFYSKLRKAMRKINKNILKKFRSQIKEVRQLVLYKIIEATDQHFKSSPAISQELIQLSRKLKTQLLVYSNENNNKFERDDELLKQLAQNVQYFSKNYKRKPKKARRGKTPSQNLTNTPKLEPFKCASDDQQGFQLEVSEEQSIQIAESNVHKQTPVNQPKLPSIQRDFLDDSKSSFRLRRLNGSTLNSLRDSYANNSLGVQTLLKNAGILDVDPFRGPFMRRSISDNSQFDMKDTNEKFNLGESVERLRYSIILKQDPQIDEQNKLFRSN